MKPAVCRVKNDQAYDRQMQKGQDISRLHEKERKPHLPRHLLHTRKSRSFAGAQARTCVAAKRSELSSVLCRDLVQARRFLFPQEALKLGLPVARGHDVDYTVVR